MTGLRDVIVVLSTQKLKHQAIRKYRLPEEMCTSRFSRPEDQGARRLECCCCEQMRVAGVMGRLDEGREDILACELPTSW